MKDAIVTVIIVAIVGGIVFASGYLVGFLHGRQVAPEPEPPRVPKDWRPPISNCPDDVELWVCIRDAMYRRDI